MGNNNKDKGNRWKDKKGSVNTSPDSNVYRAYNYFIGKGLTPEQSAGIVGNFAQESTVRLDSTIENNIGAFGIAQWLGSRRKDLETFAKENNKKASDFDLQLDFTWHELNTTEKRAFNKLKEARTPTQAAEIFVNKFERSGEKKGDSGFDRRVKYAKQFYNQFNAVNPPVDSSLQGAPNTVTNVPSLASTPFNPQSFISEFSEIEEQQTEEDLRRNEKIQEEAYKQQLQAKISQREFLAELVDSTEIPFIPAKREPIT